MIDLKKMKSEWKRKGYEDREIAELIGLAPITLEKKLTGQRTAELSATQAFIICDILQTPLDMFIKKKES